MSEPPCFSSTSRSHLSRSRTKSGLFLFCSFIFSHPLQFTFLVLFFPYIHKILSFFFPLFVTISLFLLACLTFIPSFINDKQSGEAKVSFLSASYRMVAELLGSTIDNQREEYIRLEDFEEFRVVFDNPTAHDDDGDVVNQVDKSSEAESKCAAGAGSSQEASREDFNLSSPDGEALSRQTELESFAESESNWSDMEDADDKKLGGSWQDWDDDFEVVEAMNSASNVEMKKIAPSSTMANKAISDEKKSQLSNGSEAASAGAETEENDKIRPNNSVGEEKCREDCYKSKLLKVHSHSIGASTDYTKGHGIYRLRVQSSPSLDYSYGSMRKEKEWKRTLACKLFEEHHNNAAGAGEQSSEGMDLLWETQESETSTKNKANGKKTSKQNSKNKYEIKVRDIEEEDEDSANGQLCCLQALKFSAGKMNLGGMGRPNLVKFSKAIKGIGWLHSLKKHSKKVHNGDKY